MASGTKTEKEIMKTGIHPQYFETAEIKCSCGNVIIAGSTKEKLRTELCSACHPFYTGQQKLVDTAGRVDKFEAMRKKTSELRAAARQRAEEKKKKPELYKEKEVKAEVLARVTEESKKEAKGKWGKPLGQTLSEEVVKEEMVVMKKAGRRKTTAKKMAAKTTARKKNPVKKTRGIKK